MAASSTRVRGHDGAMDDIEAFWQRAQQHADLASVPSYMGVNQLAVLRPPAWAFGATPEQADELLELVLAGTKTATASALWDYEAEGEDLPTEGTLGIVTDGEGRPRALVVTSRVRTVPFDEVDAEHAAVALFQRLIIALRLRLDKLAEREVRFGHGEVVRDAIDEL